VGFVFSPFLQIQRIRQMWHTVLLLLTVTRFFYNNHLSTMFAQQIMVCSPFTVSRPKPSCLYWKYLSRIAIIAWREYSNRTKSHSLARNVESTNLQIVRDGDDSVGTRNITTKIRRPYCDTTALSSIRILSTRKWYQCLVLLFFFFH